MPLQKNVGEASSTSNESLANHKGVSCSKAAFKATPILIFTTYGHHVRYLQILVNPLCDWIFQGCGVQGGVVGHTSEVSSVFGT